MSRQARIIAALKDKTVANGCTPEEEAAAAAKIVELVDKYGEPDYLDLDGVPPPWAREYGWTTADARVVYGGAPGHGFRVEWRDPTGLGEALGIDPLLWAQIVLEIRRQERTVAEIAVELGFAPPITPSGLRRNRSSSVGNRRDYSPAYAQGRKP